MNIFRSIKTLSAMSLVIMTAIVMSSCNNDDESGSNKTELLSFGPAGVMHGEDISFIGTHLERVTSIEFQGATVNSDQFVSQDDELIVVTVPAEAEAGTVTLKTEDGDIVSKSTLSFEVIPSFASITTTAKPGTNVTVSGNFLNWIESVWLNDLEITEFVSQSKGELVFELPLDAKTGRLVFMSGGTEPLEIETENDLTVTLPAITDLNPNPVAREEELTITGTDLDLVMSVLMKGADPITSDQFISQSTTEIKLTVPGNANKGTVTLVAFSGETIESEDALTLEGDLPPLEALDYALYIDAIENGWGNWGWGGLADFSNSENVRDGQKTIKKTYDGSYDAMRFGGGNVSLATYNEITFSIFGTPGTNGLKLNVIPNEQWGSPYVITIVEGEWTEYKLTKADLGNPTQLTDFLFQAQGWAGTLYIDHVGLRN
jgi:hypothetical protein